jgi:hypothetical protein
MTEAFDTELQRLYERLRRRPSPPTRSESSPKPEDATSVFSSNAPKTTSDDPPRRGERGRACPIFNTARSDTPLESPSLPFCKHFANCG